MYESNFGRPNILNGYLAVYYIRFIYKCFLAIYAVLDYIYINLLIYIQMMTPRIFSG